MSAIPQKHIEFCQEVARLAARHGISKIGVSFTPAFNDDWRDEIRMHWESGRHGDGADKVSISSTVLVHEKVPTAPISGDGAAS